MATKLKVVFGIDPTGHEKDITETVIIPKNVCLFCLHDSRRDINRLVKEVKTSLEHKGYDFSMGFFLLKIYTL